MVLGGNFIQWFSIETANILKRKADMPVLQILQKQLMGDVYKLFDDKIQVSHLQLHHFCQPRQNMSMQGREQFNLKNKLTLEPCIKELEYLFFDAPKKERNTYVYFHLADANLDELVYKRQDLLQRLLNLTSTGFLKIAGGVLDEAFIGPDDTNFSVAAICAFYDKIIKIFGNASIAPIVWIPERFFEDKTAEIINQVAYKLKSFHNLANIYIIVDENVIEHSLPIEWQGNIFSGWSNPNYPKLKVFVSSNYLRAIMPQSTPVEVNDYIFKVMNNTWSPDQKGAINWFISKYESLIYEYGEVLDNFTVMRVAELQEKCNLFLSEAQEKLQDIEKLFVFFVDDLEKNGSWPGTFSFAFEQNRHFIRYIEQAGNMLNPYHMKSIEEHQPLYKEIKYIKPSSYKEFSIIWNNDPFSVNKWRNMTIKFINNGIQTVEDIKNISQNKLLELAISDEDINWYINFARSPISWNEGQLNKYPEIKLNYELAQFFYSEIQNMFENRQDIKKLLTSNNSYLSHLYHIWNKNRASCPNFIGFFGGTSILFFRLHIAFQFACLATLMYKEKFYFNVVENENFKFTILKIDSDISIIDDKGDVVFAFNINNLHPLNVGFCRHREGYSDIVNNFIAGRQDIEQFALVETSGGTASSHPLVTALDLSLLQNIEVAKKMYPMNITKYDNEIDMMSPYPTALGQVWLMDSQSIDSPMDNFINFRLPEIEQIDSTLYFDEFNNSTILTYVRNIIINYTSIQIIKKYNTTDHKVIIEIWNRSDKLFTFNPVIAFPVTLDWFEGENYALEDNSFPTNGEVKQFHKRELTMVDKISNIQFAIHSSRDDTKYSSTTMYSCQPSDEGNYSVSAQYQMVLLSSIASVSLLPSTEYRVEYTFENNPITLDSLWRVNFEKMPSSLKNKIENYKKLMFSERNFSPFQELKLIYSRFPEIIFWVE
jgi:hypothetical protein